MVAPEFSAQTTAGDTVSLETYRGRTLVLYFFRRAFTPNCTVETAGFRDNYADLASHGADVLGVSADTFAVQCRFSSEIGVPFRMIADVDRSISRRYDVLFPLLPVSHRVTYVIGRGGLIDAVFNHEFAVHKHLDQVVAFVRRSALSP